MSDDEIIAILGAPVVNAMGGIKEVTRRAATDAEKLLWRYGDLTIGDWIEIVPKGNTK
jgi:hypothetical protein